MNILKKISCLTPLLLAFSSAPSWAGCTYDISNEWGSGFVANIRITNDSSSATSKWNVGWQYSGDNRITNAWGATLSGSNPYSFNNVSWNGTIPPGESVEFGVQGTSGGSTEIPLVTGSVCESSTIPITPTPTSSPTLEPTARPTATPTPTPSAVPTGTTPSPSPTPSPTPTTTPTPAPGNDLVMQEGELGFCSVDGSIDSNNAGYSGSGFANTDNAIGKKITWKISVASEGSYRLEWRFANGSSSARSATVSVNNSQGNIDFSTTGAWSSWTTDGTEINLTAGINDVTLTADTNGGLPNIDSFIILGSGVTPADCNTSSSSSSSSSSSTSSTSSSGGTGFGEICPTASPCRILPFGDSITDGYGTPGGYRIELFKKAVEAGKSITFVGEKTNGPSTVADKPFPRNHQGHSGWTIEPVGSTRGISTKLPSPALDDNPNIILLHIGTNDLRRAPNGMNERLERLVDKILEESPDSLLVVASIVPSNRSNFPNSVVITYNAEIPAMVKKKADLGYKIIHVDQYEGFPLSELGDNLHPNENGYARMANKWYESVEQYLH